MPHKVVDAGTVKRLESEIEQLNKAVSLAKGFASGGPDSLKRAAEMMDHRVRLAIQAKNNAIVEGNLVQAARFYGQEESSSLFLSVFKEPKKRVNELIEARKELERELAEYRTHEVR